MTALSTAAERSTTRSLRLRVNRGRETRGRSDVGQTSGGKSYASGEGLRGEGSSESVTSSTSESALEVVDQKKKGEKTRFPPGLSNLGNTCYFNSVLQVLYHVKAFREALLEWIPATDSDPYRFALAISLKKLFVEIRDVGDSMSTQPISPQEFLSVLREQNSEFSGYDQQDAHEFLRFLLDKVNDAFRASNKASSNIEQPSSPKRPRKSSDLNALQKVFQGAGATYTRCFQCDTVSRREESFLDVSLPVQTGCSLSWAFSQNVQKERLTDKYDCELCMTKTEAERWWQLDTVPPVVTIHLKLFTYDRNVQGKVSAAVRCPQRICFNRWCSYGRETGMYALDAVIVHEGSTMTSGHYKAYVNEDSWLCFDDSEVTRIDEAALKRKLFTPVKPKKTAYLLFYRKCDADGEKDQ